MPGIPYKYAETFARLQRATEQLHSLIASGEFYAYGYLRRRKLLRRVRKLYNQLSGPVSPAFLGSAVAAVGVLTLAGCFPPTAPPPTDGGGGGGGAVAQVPLFGAATEVPGLNGTYQVRAAKGPVVFARLDDDADLDMIYGAAFAGEGFSGYVADRTNTGTTASPAFGPERVDFFLDANPRAWNRYDHTEVLAAGDLDGDGDIDLLTSTYYGEYPYAVFVSFVENTGTPDSPAFAAPVPIPGAEHDAIAAQLVDVDGDGDLDILYLDRFGDFYGIENTRDGSVEFSFGLPQSAPPEIPDFQAENPLLTAKSFAITDLDADGDVDLLIAVYNEGSGDHEILYFENEGGVPPQFANYETNPFGIVLPSRDWFSSGWNTGADFDIAAVDLDGDGDIDLMIGPYSSYLYSGPPDYLYGFNNTFFFFENKAID